MKDTLPIGLIDALQTVAGEDARSVLTGWVAFAEFTPLVLGAAGQ